MNWLMLKPVILRALRQGETADNQFTNFGNHKPNLLYPHPIVENLFVSKAHREN